MKQENKPNEILILEDDKDIAALLCMYVRRECYEPVHYQTGREGRIYLSKYHPAAMTTDEDMICPYGMPEIKGHQVCEWARALNYTGPILHYSGQPLGEFEASRLEGLEIIIAQKPNHTAYKEFILGLRQ